jgi:hypothetical protein
VGDLAWDARSFLLCYRTKEPYLERRDLKTGVLMWAYGTKPAKGGSIPQVRHHVVMKEDGTVLLGSGDSLQLEVLDVNKGTRTETLTFTFNGKPAPALTLGEGERGGMAWWLNRNVALAAVPSSQLPPGGELHGLVLARMDLTSHVVTFIPTGADETAGLVGILEDSAVVRGSAGGLVFVPIP